MVVGCPKCKVRLNIPEDKIKPEGTKFRCPKCATLLLIKKPVTKPAPRPEGVDMRKAIVAHEKPHVVERIKAVLSAAGYRVLTAFDGVSTVLQAVKERPGLAVLDIALPKIHGSEASKRLKARPETRDMKTLLVCSKEDPKRRVRQPEPPGAIGGYVFEDEIGEKLLDAVKRATGGGADTRPSPAEEPRPVSRPSFPTAAAPHGITPPATPRPPVQAPQVSREALSAETFRKAPPPPSPPSSVSAPQVEKAAPRMPFTKVPPLSAQKDEPPDVARARRLARTIFSDIELYNPDKVIKAVREGNFSAVFDEELKEGLKLYRRRIPEEVRSKGDYFEEALKDFIAAKKRSLGLS